MSSTAVALVDNTPNYRNLAAAVLEGSRNEYIACRLFLMSADKTWPKYERLAFRRFVAKGKHVKDGERRPPNQRERSQFRRDLRDFRAQAVARARRIVEENSNVLFGPSLWSAWLTLNPERVKASLLTDEQIRAHAQRANIRPTRWAALAESRL